MIKKAISTRYYGKDGFFCIKNRKISHAQIFSHKKGCRTFEMLTFAPKRKTEHMNLGQYIFVQITRFLPKRKFERLVEKYNDRIDYSLLILSTNSSGVSISILEKPNHFLPKSLMDAPM